MLLLSLMALSQLYYKCCFIVLLVLGPFAKSQLYYQALFVVSDDETGDNPIMIAAKLRHKDLVSSVLRSNRFDGSDDIDFLGELIHSRNASGQTLLAMVALQGKKTNL